MFFLTQGAYSTEVMDMLKVFIKSYTNSSVWPKKDLIPEGMCDSQDH